MALPNAQNRYLGNKWNAQIQYAKDQYSNSLNSYNQQVGALKFNTWGNAADAGNTRGSYNSYALTEGRKPLDTGLSVAQQQRDMTIAEIQRARAAAAAAAAARKKAEEEAKKQQAAADSKKKAMDIMTNRLAGPEPQMYNYYKGLENHTYSTPKEALDAYNNDYISWRTRKSAAYSQLYLPD